MKSAETIVVNPTGLHARPASTFARAAAQFHCDVKIKNLSTDSVEVNAKSTMRILTLAMSQGSQIRITAEGEDETTAVENLIALVDSGFGEI